MLRRESIGGSLGGVAAPAGRAAGSENRAHRPLVPTGRDTRGAKSSVQFGSKGRNQPIFRRSNPPF
jgi:hypothetical protein